MAAREGLVLGRVGAVAGGRMRRFDAELDFLGVVREAAW